MELKIKITVLFFAVCVTLTHAQDFATQLQQKLDQWAINNPQLKPYLEFNQEKYSPGDTVFFKAYFLTENLKPVAGRQIMRLTVLNQKGREIVYENFRMKDGSGYNQLVLPDSIEAGLYQFVVYNDWMKKANRFLPYRKTVPVVRKNKLSSNSINTPLMVSFFPEGEKLIAGLSNRVIIKAENNVEQTANGSLLDNENKLITSFSLNDQLGSVLFTPAPGKKYYAELNGKRFDLPPVHEDGLTLLVTPNPNRQPLKALISAPPNSKFRNEQLTIVLSAHNQIYYSASASLFDKDFIQVMIPQTNLPAGIAMISLFSNNEKIASRLCPITSESKIDASLIASRSAFQNRDEITVNFSLNDSLGKPIQGEFSVAALNQKLFSDKLNYSLTDEMIFFNGVSERITIDHNDPDWFRLFDQWLITQTWKPFNWANILTSSDTKTYKPNAYIHVKGKVLFRDTKQPVPDSTLVFMYLQKNTMGYESYTSKGNFEVDFLFDFWGQDDVFLSTEWKGKELKNVVIELERDIIENTDPLPRTSTETDQPDEYGLFAFNKRIINKSYSYYASPPAKTMETFNPNADFEDEILGADASIKVDDYIVFSTMEDLIREIIPALNYRLVNGKPSVRVVLSEPSIIPKDDPLYMIDGIMTRNTDLFLHLKPGEIVSVKIVKDINKLNRLGNIGKNGIVIVQTKKLMTDIVKKSSTIFSVEGLNKPIDFRKAIHTDAPRIPDFRSTLFWSPSLKTDSNGKSTFSFYASDDVGPISIRVTGITNDGRPFSSNVTVDVKYADTANRK